MGVGERCYVRSVTVIQWKQEYGNDTKERQIRIVYSKGELLVVIVSYRYYYYK